MSITNLPKDRIGFNRNLVAIAELELYSWSCPRDKLIRQLLVLGHPGNYYTSPPNLQSSYESLIVPYNL